MVLVTSVTLADAPSGEQIWLEQCARCHGNKGQGTPDNYPDALAGDKSIPQLATLIRETMPEDEETKCTPQEAELVAAYMHNAFYSADAQLRNKPARVELSRLTVRQHQNAVADLVGHFRPAAEWGGERGMRGEYNQSRYIGNEKKPKFARVDAQIDFDFGDEPPGPEIPDAKEFSVVWQGAVFAPDSGDYEFVVRSDHAVRLYVNNLDAALFDAWVKSGDETEHRGTIRLLGGRAYPIKLEFSKANQGVNDAKKQEDKAPAKAHVRLLWQRPGHTLEVVPPRSLSPQVVPELFVLTAPFPPDDRSVGYERGTAISKAWDEATTEAAIESAGYVVEHLQELAGARADDASGEPLLRGFAREFVERAFRRPLSEEEVEVYVHRQFEGSTDLATAVKRVVLLSLKSPRFLYREVDQAAPDGFDVASRMSFGLWDSLPDAELMRAAGAGELASREQISAQLTRMLSDVRTQTKLREFLLQWLKVSQARDLAKDPAEYPEFTPDIASDLRTSLEMSIEELASSEAADYRQFLLTDAIYLNGRLAKIYGVEKAEDAAFEKVSFQPELRAGLITHPYLLAQLAYPSTTSPIHRGVFLSRNVLGRVLRPPPEAAAPFAPEMHADLTTRERVALQTEPEACQSCHRMINPLGFTLENFDAIGRYRTAEKDRPVDASGSYLTPTGELQKFSGVKDLAAFLVGSDEAQRAFVKQLFHHAAKQPILAYGPDQLARLQTEFVKNDFNVRRLLVEIVAASSIPPDVTLAGKNGAESAATTAEAHAEESAGRKGG